MTKCVFWVIRSALLIVKPFKNDYKAATPWSESSIVEWNPLSGWVCVLLWIPQFWFVVSPNRSESYTVSIKFLKFERNAWKFYSEAHYYTIYHIIWRIKNWKVSSCFCSFKFFIEYTKKHSTNCSTKLWSRCQYWMLLKRASSLPSLLCSHLIIFCALLHIAGCFYRSTLLSWNIGANFMTYKSFNRSFHIKKSYLKSHT